MMKNKFSSLPTKKFNVIYADPPWHFRTMGPKGRNRCPDWRPFKGEPERHYPVASIEELCALPVAEIADDNCVLFMWISWPLLEDALKVIKAWGFTYKTCAFAWTKANAFQIDMLRDDLDVSMGLGYWTRSNSEVCLMATRGKPKRISKSIRQAIIEPRREHSRKPDCVYGRIERLVGGPYIELFARNERPGWYSWGNETDKFPSTDSSQRGEPNQPKPKPHRSKKNDRSDKPKRKPRNDQHENSRGSKTSRPRPENRKTGK